MKISNEAASLSWQHCLRAGAALVLLCAAAAAQACPSMPARAQLKTMRVEGLRTLALQRWLKCGWEASGPALRRWRTAALEAWIRVQREEGPFFDRNEALASNDFASHLYALVQLNPAEIDDLQQELEEELQLNEAAALADLLQLEVDEATRLAHYEAGTPAAVALLQRDFVAEPGMKLNLELILVRHEVRQGRIDAARTRLDRAEAAWLAQEQNKPGSPYDQRPVDALRRVLEPPVLQSSVPGNRGWKLYRVDRFQCGTAELRERRYGVNYLRPYVLRNADPDAVLAELLDGAWYGEINGDSRNTGVLAGLLRQRRSAAELAQDWRDALASLRADDEVAGLAFQGRFLPLPAAVVETGETPDSTRERRLSVEELSEIVRATPLYRELHATR